MIINLKIRLLALLRSRKYELLLAALIVHLYIGIFISDLEFYTRVIWPINMVMLGIASVGVFIKTSRTRKLIQNILWVIACILPLSISAFGQSWLYMSALSVFYCIFFGFILIEIIKFLITPTYINVDIISAAACGYFLLVEIAVFVFQALYYRDAGVLLNVSDATPAETFMDLVYFSSISITSIGFGDITPTSHITKLITSLFGVVGQFYSVVLVGILISKFVSAQDPD